MRAHPEPIGYYTPAPRSPLVQTAPIVPTVLFAVPESERTLYLGEQFIRHYVTAAAEAAKFILTARPRLVVIDWDEPTCGGVDVCTAARTSPTTSVLVTTVAVEKAPAILKAGCHGILLKPFAPNLLASRMARVIKETERPWGHKMLAASPGGTNRVWQDSACPKCGTHGPTSFDFSSYRRMWYACLTCDHTWLGPRQE